MKVELYIDEPYIPNDEGGTFIDLPLCPGIGDMIQMGDYDYKVESITWIVRDVRHVTPWPMLFLSYPQGEEFWQSFTKRMAESRAKGECKEACALCGQGLEVE